MNQPLSAQGLTSIVGATLAVALVKLTSIVGATLAVALVTYASRRRKNSRLQDATDLQRLIYRD